MAMEIIPGLPDDIGRECLLRVPFTSLSVFVKPGKTLYTAGFSIKTEIGCCYCLPFNYKLFVLIGLVSERPSSRNALVIYDFSSGTDIDSS
ncbi:hypothetical protein SUGI_1097010 [Cryptomeria japonica]|nr:hypothetical protein SUGI_1097010 [Cryptomeria japonica]